MTTVAWVLMILALVNYAGVCVMYRWLRESLAANRELLQALDYCQTYGRHSFTPHDYARLLAATDIPATQRPKRYPPDPNPTRPGGWL